MSEKIEVGSERDFGPPLTAVEAIDDLVMFVADCNEGWVDDRDGIIRQGIPSGKRWLYLAKDALVARLVRELGVADALPDRDALARTLDKYVPGHLTEFLGELNLPGDEDLGTGVFMACPDHYWHEAMTTLRRRCEEVVTDAELVRDETEYVLVSKLWPDRDEFKSSSTVTKFLDKLPNEPAPSGIRNYRKGQRRYVHETDWHRYFRQKDQAKSEALDGKGMQAIIDGVEAGKAKERDRRK